MSLSPHVGTAKEITPDLNGQVFLPKHSASPGALKKKICIFERQTLYSTQYTWISCGGTKPGLNFLGNRQRRMHGQSPGRKEGGLRSWGITSDILGDHGVISIGTEAAIVRCIGGSGQESSLGCVGWELQGHGGLRIDGRTGLHPLFCPPHWGASLLSLA